MPKAVFNTVPVFVQAASGAIVDVDGNGLIDFGAGLAVLNTGNDSPAVVETYKLDRRMACQVGSPPLPWPPRPEPRSA